MLCCAQTDAVAGGQLRKAGQGRGMGQVEPRSRRLALVEAFKQKNACTWTKRGEEVRRGEREVGCAKGWSKWYVRVERGSKPKRTRLEIAFKALPTFRGRHCHCLNQRASSPAFVVRPSAWLVVYICQALTCPLWLPSLPCPLPTVPLSLPPLESCLSKTSFTHVAYANQL